MKLFGLMLYNKIDLLGSKLTRYDSFNVKLMYILNVSFALLFYSLVPPNSQIEKYKKCIHI